MRKSILVIVSQESQAMTNQWCLMASAAPMVGQNHAILPAASRALNCSTEHRISDRFTAAQGALRPSLCPPPIGRPVKSTFKRTSLRYPVLIAGSSAHNPCDGASTPPPGAEPHAARWPSNEANPTDF